jgi:hypothetical protein
MARLLFLGFALTFIHSCFLSYFIVELKKESEIQKLYIENIDEVNLIMQKELYENIIKDGRQQGQIQRLEAIVAKLNNEVNLAKIQ